MQRTKTTIHLKLPDPRAWWNLSTPAAITICLFALLSIVGIVGRMPPAQPLEAVPTPALLIVFSTAAPTAAPTQPTPDQQVYVELEQLRARVAELEAQQAAPQPAVVDVPVSAPEPPAAPEPVYQVVDAPEVAVATPEPLAPQRSLQTLAVLDRQAWAEQVATLEP